MHPTRPAFAHPDRPTARRRLRRRDGRPGLGRIWFVLLFPHLWIGLFVAGMAVFEIAFPFMAHDAIGHVRNKHESTSSKGGHTYYVDYDVDVDGAVVSDSASVSSGQFAALSPGDGFPVRVGRAFGAVHTRTDSGFGGVFIGLFALFWNGIVGVFVWVWAVQPLLRWWLVRSGVGVAGEVVTRGAPKKGSVRVEYRFVPDGHGLPLERSMMVPINNASALPQRVTVFHHPQRPTVATIYEATSWEVVR